MLEPMSPLLLALTLSATAPVAGEGGFDEGAVAQAVEELMIHGQDAVRVAVPPLDDHDALRRGALERALVRALLARRREEVVTPATLRARLRAQGEAQERQLTAEELRALSCDHLLLGAVVDEGGEAVLYLQLVLTERSEVLGEAKARLGLPGSDTSARAPGVRAAVEEVVEQVAVAVESHGDDVRTERLAVGLPRADGPAEQARLDRFVQTELSRALRERGFLVVERARLAASLDQLAVAQALDEDDGVKVGRLLGADAMVVSAIAEAGAVFRLDVRVVDVESGAVLGAGSAPMPRDDVVARAAVETRTPLEAGARSLVAPGWGQAYNGDGTKALVFGLSGYGGLVTTAALAVGTAATSFAYDAVEPGPELTPAESAARARALFELRNVLLFSTAVAGAATTMLWGGGVVDALVSAPHDGRD